MSATTIRNTITTDDAGVLPAPPEAHQRAGVLSIRGLQIRADYALASIMAMSYPNDEEYESGVLDAIDAAKSLGHSDYARHLDLPTMFADVPDLKAAWEQGNDLADWPFRHAQDSDDACVPPAPPETHRRAAGAQPVEQTTFDPAALFSRHTKQCALVSGCHWEIYQANLIRSLRKELDSLAPGNRAAFLAHLAECETDVDDEALAAAELEEREFWDNDPDRQSLLALIREDNECNGVDAL